MFLIAKYQLDSYHALVRVRDAVKGALTPIKTWKHVSTIYDTGVTYREILIRQPYYWLWKLIKPGTTVVDVGGAYADTAIYFAMNPNTLKVLAFERDPHNSELAFQNLKSTNKELALKIHFLNESVVSPSRMNEILDCEESVALKVDCEGCEYDIITNEVNLKNVYAVVMEYHAQGSPETISSLLREKGFRVEIFGSHESAEYDKGSGLIQAERNHFSRDSNQSMLP